MVLSNYYIEGAMNNLKCHISQYFWATVFKITNIIILALFRMIK